MTTDLKRRLAALEAHASPHRPVSEMSDAELLAIIGLGKNPSDEQLLEVAGTRTPAGQNTPASVAELSKKARR